MAVRRSKKFIVSACLAGIDCTYNGKNKLNRRVERLVKTGVALPVCPELLGGSKTPRSPCEITGGDGNDVLNKKARVVTRSGSDITKILLRGGRRALKIAGDHGIKDAILKSKSPSCGHGKIYDGTFHKKLIKGDGVTTALFIKHGIRVFNEKGR